MEGSDSILSSMVMPVDPLGNTTSGFAAVTDKAQASAVNSAGAEKTKQLAKDFESVLLTKLVDEMKNTTNQWGFEEDAASEQVQGLFWMYLARDAADKGGIGLWKDLYRFFSDVQNPNTQTQSLDESL